MPLSCRCKFPDATKHGNFQFSPSMTVEHQKSPEGTVGESSTLSFSRFATRVSAIAGSSWIFMLACLGIVVWLFTGPYFHYSDTWQLIINTATTVITFLMVFLIQNTQNRDTLAMNLKLDEIIRSIRHAHNEMINIEKLSDEELADLAKHYERIREEHDHRAARKLLKDAKKNIPA
jgi:low affinity Fe/Cu permease